ncbi:UvrD-helicase domain-containing protein [Deinococcus metalli]|uniref:UvrD-helicase domain-containing protein n=1 Tax=Deinococcus metalli TaxID=1141878 RepID=UPI0036182AF6
MLTGRILAALERGVRPHAIVAVTFTVAAAAELQGRVRDAVRERAAMEGGAWTDVLSEWPLMTVTTIHGLCARIARDHPAHSGAGLSFDVLDEADSRVWERLWRSRVLAELPPEVVAQVPEPLRTAALQALVEHDVPPGSAPQSGDAGALHRAIQQLTRHVQQRLEALRVEQGLATFGDLERWAWQALQHEEVRAHYAERWTHLLIDEVQDTGERQAAILRALCAEGVVVTAVGDEKQSIYGFRGASASVLPEIRELVLARGGQILDMHTSFRSAPELVDTVNAACQHLMPGPEVAGPEATPFTPLIAARPAQDSGGAAVDLQIVQGGTSAGRAITLARVLVGRMQALLGHPIVDRSTGTQRPAGGGT